MRQRGRSTAVRWAFHRFASLEAGVDVWALDRLPQRNCLAQIKMEDDAAFRVTCALLPSLSRARSTLQLSSNCSGIALGYAPPLCCIQHLPYLHAPDTSSSTLLTHAYGEVTRNDDKIQHSRPERFQDPHLSIVALCCGISNKTSTNSLRDMLRRTIR